MNVEANTPQGGSDPRGSLPEMLAIARKGHFLPHAVLRALVTGVSHGYSRSADIPKSVRRSYQRTMIGVAIALGTECTALRLASNPQSTWVPIILTGIWFLAAAVLVGSQLGLVRSPAGQWYEGFGGPNTLTFFRFVNIPLVISITPLFPTDRGLLGVGSVIFVLVALSDMADGFLARATGQISEFGRIYDPVCDILFNAGLCFAMYLADFLPLWYVALAELRFILPIVGGAWVFVYSKPWKIRPTLWGKATVFVYALTVALILLRQLLGSPFLYSLVERFIVISGILLAFNLLVILDRGASLLARRE